MIDGQLVARLDVLARERSRLVGQAAGIRLQVVDAMGTLIPHMAKVDMTIQVLRYLREHWAVTGTLLALAGFALRKRIGMIGLAQLVLRIGGKYLAH